MSRRSTLGLAAALALLASAASSRAAGPVGELYVPITGCRALDTRLPAGPLGGPAFSASEARVLPVAGTCGVPADALALAVNLTVVDPQAAGFAVLYAGDSPLPPTSNLSFKAHKTRAAFSIVALAGDASGTIALANGSPGSADFLLDVQGYFIRACTSTITVTNPGVATGTVGAAFSQTFTGSGGVGGLSFSTASALPQGLSLSGAGVLSGTPNEPGTFDVVVTATDANGCTGSGATYHLVVACQTITVTNPATTTGTANAPFSQQFTQAGGSGATTFSTTDPLPIGLTLAANGLLSGTPTQAGAFNVVVTATDANGCTGAGATYPLVINCQTITVANPASNNGTAGTAFSQTFTQTGAIGTATFTTASTLPAGLALAANGVLSGTPTQVGTFPIVVTVTDANLCTGTSATYNLTIGCQTVAVSNPATTAATAGTAFSQPFTQSGAIGTATFTTASTLPTGLTLAANGVLSGTPTQTGTFPVVVVVTDANGCAGAGATYNLVVSCQTFSVEPTGLPPATAGVAYPGVTFTAPDGIGGVTISFAGSLPTGMSLVAGVLSGTPTQTGSFPVTVTATDANGCTAQRDYILVVSCPATPITLAPSALPSFAANAPIAPVTFTASGGTGPYTFQQVGALPAGMSFAVDTLSGTPTETGAFPVTITATDAGSCVGSQDYVVTVTCDGVTITVAPPTIPSVQAGSPFAPVTFTASGGAGPYTFQKTGTLPAGMTFLTDTLSGTPTQQGTFPITVTATDANGCVGSTSYSLVVTCPTITVTNPGVTTGTVNAAFSEQFTQSGGQGAVTFSLASGSLPAGLTLSAAGVLSGTPTVTGSFPITVKATDANGCTGTGATYTLVVNCQTITVNVPAVSSGADGAPFSQTFTQTGGQGATTFTLASGSLPGGWTFTSAGVLANATPTPVSFSITVLATDANGCSGTSALYTVSIVPSAANDTYAPAIVGNMSIDTNTGTTFSVLTNDSAGTTAAVFASPAHGTLVLASNGTFTYAPDRGYEGPDSFQYKATHTASGLVSAAATVSLTVTGVVWFVDDNPGACSAGCDGRRATPYTTLAAFQAVNDGTGTNPKAGHAIFLFESPTPYTGPVAAPVALLPSQKLVGQDFAGTFAAAVGLTVPDTTVGVPVLTPGAPFSAVASVAGQNIVLLSTGNTLRGLGLTPTNDAAVAFVGPGDIGTSLLDQVLLAPSGPASGISLATHTGVLNVQNGSIVGIGTGTAVAVLGAANGSVAVTNTPVNRTGGRLLDVQSRTGGAVTFDAASRLTLAGGTTDGIVLQTNTATTLDLLGGFSVTTTAGRGFFANNTGTVTIGGAPSLVDATGGSALSITSTTIAGSPTFTSVTSTNPSGQGILLSNASGGLTIGTTTVSGSGTQRILVTGSTINASFGTTILNGGTDAVSLQNNSAGTRTFGSLTIGNAAAPSAVGFLHGAGGGAATVTGATTITNPGGNGIDVQNSASPITFNGVTVSKNNAGVGVNLGNDTGLVTFGSLSISSVGTAFSSGTASVSTSGGTINATGASAILAASTNFNSSTLTSVSSSGGVNGISLVTSSGSLSITGGSITGATGASFVVTGGSVSPTYSGGITQGTNNAMVSVSGGHTGTLTFTGGTLSAAMGTGLQFDNADGTYNFNGTTTLNGGDAGIDILNGSGGTFTFGGNTTITNPSGTAFTLNSSAPTVTYSGNITKGNAGLMVDITSQTGGTVTFQTGTLNATAGSGVLLDNADGTVNFNGTTTLNGGDAGVDVQNGSAGTITFGSNTSIANPTGIAYREDTSTATVNFNGTITKSNNAATAVSINVKTGGATTFSGAVSASTTTANAINLTNTGGTVTFRGGLAATTTSGVAFNATGSGATVAVCDENPCNAAATGALVNTLTSTTGTALNVANTTIGANNLEFQKISSNGATNGIVLNTTGASGGLKVKGNGGACTSSATCTGGAIQNATVGVSLTSTTSPSFDRLFIQNTTSHGVSGTAVTNFTFTNGVVDNSGTGLGAETANLAFNTTAAGTENNLSGVVTITGNTLTTAYYHGIDIFNFNGTISDAQISNNTITSTNSTATSKGSGIRFIAFGSASTIANVTKATIANNVVSNFPSAAGIMAQGGNGNAAGPAGVFGTAGSGTNVIAITGNRVAGFSAANRIGTQAILAVVNGKGQGAFNIANNGTVANPITNVFGTAIAVSSFGFANVTADVTNNVVVANNAVGAQGIGAGTSQTFAASDTPSLTVNVLSNNISQTDGNGILVTARDATGTLKAKIQSNTVAAPLSGNRNGIRVDAGNGVSVNDSVCLNISGNTSAGVGLSPEGIGLRKQGTTAGTNNLAVHGLGTSPATAAQTAAFVTAQNPGSASGTLIINGDNFNSPTCSFP